MRFRNVSFLVLLSLCVPAWGQQELPSQPSSQVPIYRVTVVGRTIKAINYGHRTEPTKIDFRGTVLEPGARGEARVESKRGAADVQAKFEKLLPPTKFGRQYLTYVLWAITPEGRPVNLGEIVLDDSNKAKLHVTADLQAFALLVTAEPYYSVAQPSDVVVMENVVRSDTIGNIQTVEAKYELMPRGQYTMDTAAAESRTEGKKLSLDRYEAVLELYQAQNAVQIAQSEGADRYAADTLRKAQQLLQQAQNYQAQKGSAKQVVTTAREAAQAAEDSRAITAKRREEERKANERKVTAEREATGRGQAETAAQAASEPPPATQPAAVEPAAADARVRVAQQLSGILDTRDTPRGVAVSLYENLFDAGRATLRPEAREKLSQISGVVSAYPGLKAQVEGYTNGMGDQDLYSQRAEAVRDYLLQRGITATSITARGFSMRPPEGSPQRRRVDIILSGQPIGAVSVSRLDRTALGPGGAQ
jgi:outer membrane protein OmpA-like peptidoglycan-associated protein